AEGKQLGKLESIPRLLELGLSKAVLADALDLPLEVVQSAADLFHQENLTAVIELLNNHSSLFSAQDLAELAELIAPLPDNREDLSSAIAIWFKQPSRVAQFTVLKEIRQSLSSGTVEEGLTDDVTPVNSADLIINQEMLLATISSLAAID
ncbi:hypothetical protein NJ959_10105, partial [Symplocastrum sp. BBK-W-15]|nr:hypothetical protein [Limnofasciculus baicalensis BBK-W-15]